MAVLTGRFRGPLAPSPVRLGAVMCDAAAMDVGAVMAQHAVEATLGLPVELWDTGGRQGAVDLRWEVDGLTVACEVKVVVDEDHRAAEALSGRHHSVDGLTRHWTAYMRRGSHFGKAAKQLPLLLRLLEEDGHEDLRMVYRSERHPLLTEVDELGIDSLWSRPATERLQPGFEQMPASWGGGVPDMDTVSVWASDLVASVRMDKLRVQLSRAEDVDQRHAFLLVAWEYMAHIPLTGGRTGLPIAPPRLPRPIDGLWLAGLSGSPRVVAWLPNRGWIEGRPWS